MRSTTTVWAALCVMIVAWAAPALAAPPTAASALAACQNKHPQAPATSPAAAPANGLMAVVNVPTPAQAAGAVTVSARVGGCLVETMGEKLAVLAAVRDREGIPEAWSWPLAGLQREPSPAERETLAKMFSQMTDGDKSRAILIYCHHTSCGLSYNAVHHLRAAGYRNLFWMREGIQGWRAAGLPVGLTLEGGTRRLANVVPAIVDWEAQADNHYPAPPKFWDDPSRLATLRAIGLSVSEACEAAHWAMPAEDKTEGLELVSLMKKAAGVQAQDRADVERRKMRAFFERHNSLLACRGLSIIGIADSHLFKVAAKGNQGFIRGYLLEEWRLSGDTLNHVDPEDGLTLLDYVQGLYSRRAADRPSYLPLFQELRAAGAMTHAELVAARKVKSPEVLQAEYLPMFVRLAEAGDTGAMLHLSSVYRGGRHVPKDPAAGDRWRERAERRVIETNNYYMMQQFGSFLYHNEAASQADLARAVEWFERAAAGGNADGKFYIGRAYIEGRGVRKDIPRGIALLKELYKEGFVDSELWVARGYAALRDWKNLPLWLRVVRGQFVKIEGKTAPEWMADLNIPICGPTADPNYSIACEGKNRYPPGKAPSGT